MKLAIGLPSFLLDKENRTQILALFFFFILIVLPGIFFYNYSDSYKYEDSGVLKENRMILFRKLNENMLAKSVVSCLCQATEFQTMVPRTQNDFITVNKMRMVGELENIVPAIKIEKGKMPFEWKPSILLYSHLLGYTIPESQKEDYNRMLRLAPFLLDQMIDTGLEIDALYRQRRIQKRVGMMPIYLMI